MKRRPTTKLLRTGAVTENGRTLPAARAAAMYADYQGGLSLEAVGEKYGRTRQSVFGLFQQRGWKMRAKKFQTVVLYGGRRYTTDGNGYLRDTAARSAKYCADTFLHRLIWRERRGPIPPGHDVIFRDGNRANVRISNLLCLPHAEQQARGRIGRNQFTVSARQRFDLLLGNHNAGRRTFAAEVKR